MRRDRSILRRKIVQCFWARTALKASRAQLSTLRENALPHCGIVDFPVQGQPTTDYDAFLHAVQTHADDTLQYLAVGLIGQAVRLFIMKGLSLTRSIKVWHAPDVMDAIKARMNERRPDGRRIARTQRIFATLSAVIVADGLPNCVVTKFTSVATSLSLNSPAKAGIDIWPLLV